MTAQERQQIFAKAVQQLRAERDEQRRLDRERAWQAGVSLRHTVVDERAA